MAFDDSFLGLSPGKILFQEKIKSLFQQAVEVKEFDLLRGGSYIKSKWTSAYRQHLRVIFFNQKIYTRFIMILVFYIRPFIKKILRLFNKNFSN
jgi:CelD/BcsL family acetyltransferase involved in cellulose biosynthesis